MTAETTVTPPAALPDLIRAGEWRRAAAAAHGLGEPADVVDVLQSLRAVQEDLRARRYAAARTRLSALQPDLDALSGGVAAELRLYVRPSVLRDAVQTLEDTQREADPAVLTARLDAALAEPLTRAEALNALGVLHARLGHDQEARTALDAARAADPGHYRALTNLGNLDMEAGQFAQAEAIYRQVINMAPEYDGGHHNLGVAVRRQGRVSEGVRHIRQGQRLSLKRSREETQAEAKEQLSRTPALKYLRFVLIAALILIVFLTLRHSGG